MKQFCSIIIFLCSFLISNGQGIQLKKGEIFTYRISRFDESSKFYTEDYNNKQFEDLVRMELKIKVVDQENDYFLIKVLRTDIDRYRRQKPLDRGQWETISWYSEKGLLEPRSNMSRPGYSSGIKTDSMLIKLSTNGEIIEIQDFKNNESKGIPDKPEVEAKKKEFFTAFLLEFFFFLPENLNVGEMLNQDTVDYKLLEKNKDFWLLEKLPVKNQKVTSAVKVDANTGMLIESTNAEFNKKNVERTSPHTSRARRMSLHTSRARSNEYYEEAKIISRYNMININNNPYACRFKVNENIRDSIFYETNVTIKGSIKNPPKKRTVSLLWFKTGVSGRSSIEIKTELNESNQFEIRLNIDDIQKVSLNFQGTRTPFYIMPGDDITIDFDYTDHLGSINCRGTGSNSIKYAIESLRFDKNESFDLKKINTSCYNIQFSLDAESFENYTLKAIGVKVDFLDSWKNKIAPEVYLAEYWLYQTTLVGILQPYIGNQVITSKKLEWQSSGDSTYRVSYKNDESKKLDVSKYIHPDNDMMAFFDGYEDFLSRYTFWHLQNHIKSLTGVGRSYSPDRDNRLNNELSAQYDFSHSYYSGKSSYLLKYNIVNKAFKRGDWAVSKKFYNRFANEYPMSKMTKLLTEDFKKVEAISPGNAIYDFELEDFDGKSVKLSDFRGKALYLVFLHCNDEIYGSNMTIERYGSELFETIQGENAELIYISRTENVGKSKAYFDKKELKGTKLTGENIDDIVRKRFFADYGPKYIILDVDGKIVYKETPSPDEIVKDPFLLLKACKPLFRVDNSSRKILILKIISLSLLVLVLVTLFIIIINKRRAAQKFKLANLNTRIRELELRAIRAQMNPHFMYNCLNSIQNLVQKRQTEQAHLYLSKFADLIRLSLKKSDKEEATLSEEIELIKQYVELEQLRYDIDFEVTIEKGIDPFSVYIPPLLLQPIVENAIVHGLSSKTGIKKLRIFAKRTNGHICISVEDNGIGREASSGISKVTTGKGLGFTKERLDLISEKYGIRNRLDIYDLKNKEEVKGTKVEICFVDE